MKRDNHRRSRQGAGDCSPLNFGKLAKISHNRAENRLKVGQNFRKRLTFYRAVPPKFYSLYAYADSESFASQSYLSTLNGARGWMIRLHRFASRRCYHRYLPRTPKVENLLKSDLTQLLRIREMIDLFPL